MRMSPISAPEPCPHIIQRDTFYFCGIYANRPNECRNHKFHCRICPIGIDKLKLDEAYKVSNRIDEAWEIIKSFKEVSNESNL